MLASIAHADHSSRPRSSSWALRYSQGYRERRTRATIAVEPMAADHDPVAIREIALHELTPGAPLQAAFRMLHREWHARGVSRWLDLLSVRGAHPVVVFGAFADHGRVLVGAVVGVWSAAPIERFDDLFDAPPAVARALARPRGGAWHLIAVTTDPRREVRGLGLGRALLARVLGWAADGGHRIVRTLSPALGLPELLADWPHGRVDAVTRAARRDGKPVLQVLRLHLGGGASLERILPQSRANDRASAHVTLRFRYATDPDARRRQRERWKAWCAARAEAIAHGRAETITRETYRVVTDLDATLVSEAR